MKTQRSFLVLAVILCILCVNVGTSNAMPPLPSSFYGTVKIEGINVAVGTSVTAWINGIQYAGTTAEAFNSDVIYALDVPGDDTATTGVIEGGVAGNTVVFHVGGYVATQTGTWSTGTDVQLNLDAPEELCYTLTLTHTGNGSNPVASPTNSEDCPSGQYLSGEAINLSGATPDTDWYINGWTGTADDLFTGNYNSLIMPSSNHTAGVVYSSFAGYHFLLTSVVGNGTVSPNSGNLYVQDEEVTLSATADPGWSFIGWSGDKTGTENPTTIIMDTDKDVTANFAEDFTLTINTVGSGSVIKDPDQTVYHIGDMVDLQAVPAAGWTFTGWSGDLTGSENPATLTITGDMTVTATFAQAQYTLTVTSAHGTVAKNPDQVTYLYGDVVQLTATPADGWAFANWSDDATGTANPVSVTMNGNKSVTANYTQIEYTLTITSAHGTVAKNPDQATYHYGDVVQLTATPAAGWTFANWSGDTTGTDNPVSVTIERQ